MHLQYDHQHSHEKQRAFKRSILEYIRLEAAKRHYPTFMEIEEKFHTNLRTHFSGIKEAYWLANVPYKREPNQFLKYEKERKLTDISVNLFRKMGYLIEKISIGPRGSGPDVILRNGNGNLIPVEIKAYQKFGKIKDKEGDAFSHYFRNEIKQLQEYEMQLKSPYGYLVTSTDRKSFQSTNQRIKILFSKDIMNFLIEYGMKKELKTLDWIRETPILAGKERKIKAMRKSILNYVKNKLSGGNYVSKREIQAKFKVDLRNYFKTMKDVYQAAGIDPYSLSHARMGGQIDKEVLKKRIVSYVRKEAKKSNYPTYKEIQKRFLAVLNSRNLNFLKSLGLASENLKASMLSERRIYYELEDIENEIANQLGITVSELDERIMTYTGIPGELPHII